MILERLADYMVINLYFPEVNREFSHYLEKILFNNIEKISFINCIDILLTPGRSYNEISSEELKIINLNVKKIINVMNKLENVNISHYLDQYDKSVKKHPFLPIEIINKVSTD